jgi:hypothetical protein
MLHLCSPQVLLEPVRDAATMEQVVARAHRLGATGPVRVETLVVLLELPDDLAHLPAVPSSDLSSSSSSSSKGGKGKGSEVLAAGKLAICDECYRSFPSLALAQQHEAQCPRNPANATRLREADAASSGGVPRLESLYRAIKPPPPMATSADAARTTA